MRSPLQKLGFTGRKGLLKAAALLAVLTMIAVVAGLLAAPRLVERVLHQQLEDVEAKLGVAVSFQEFETLGAGGLRLRGLVFDAEGQEEPLASIEEVEATADLFQIFRGRPAVSSLELRGVVVTIYRRQDNTSVIDDLLASLGADRDDALGAETDLSRRDDPITARLQPHLRHFGGSYPHLRVHDGRLELSAHDDARPWPVEEVTTELLWIDGDSSKAPFGGRLDLISSPGVGGSVVWPESIEIEGVLHLPAESTTVEIAFEPELRLRKIPGAPMTEVALSSIAVRDDFTVELSGPTIESTLGSLRQRLASASLVRVEFSRWATSPRDLKVVDLEIQSPHLFVEYGPNGASNLLQFYEIARQSAGRHVRASAETVAEAIVADLSEGDGDEPGDGDRAAADPDGDQAPEAGPLDRVMERIARFSVEEWLTERLPRETTLRDVRLIVEDHRTHTTLTHPARDLTFTGDLLRLRHSPLKQILEGELRFEITGDDEVGRADIEFAIPYRRGDWNATVDVDGLHLSHLAQLAGPRVARYLHGGALTSSLTIAHDRDLGRTTFDGMIAGRGTQIWVGAIAEDPIAFADGSLRMKGFYDPALTIPEAQFISSEDEDEDEDEDDLDGLAAAAGDDEIDGLPPNQGGFVVEEALGRLGDLEASLTFALYGLDGAERPARADLTIDLETTPLQTIIDAVPAALRGALDGLQMKGSLAWQFAIEVPLHRASDMRWDASVDLSSNVEIVAIPDEVNVHKLFDEFEHTIVDEWERSVRYRKREFSYERTVKIPTMRPTPASWLLENTPLSLRQIDAQRRRREWPPVPEWHRELGISPEKLRAPDFWLTDLADRGAAPRPWREDRPRVELGADDTQSWWQRLSGGQQAPAAPASEPARRTGPLPVEEMLYEPPDPNYWQKTEITIDVDRHGTYVFVPLHHISPYMVRAIMTTEDGSFFTHSGFNFTAIRHAVEANLEAGRYVRGASTISMQLAKNLFLDRDRVLSRKLQEVALVWLMESVADVPKERMLEVYLNIIEFGPGIYGIHEASVYYFGKRPDALTVAEAAWLVSIVPNPKRFHQYYDRGEITPYWFRRMSRYVRAMYNRDRISEEEMEIAVEGDPPVFYIPEEGEPLLRAQRSAPLQPDLVIEEDDQEDRGLVFPDFRRSE